MKRTCLASDNNKKTKLLPKVDSEKACVFQSRTSRLISSMTQSLLGVESLLVRLGVLVGSHAERMFLSSGPEAGGLRGERDGRDQRRGKKGVSGREGGKVILFLCSETPGAGGGGGELWGEGVGCSLGLRIPLG